MAKTSWQASEADLNMAKNGCIMQAESRGIDVNDPKIADFIENQCKVIATSQAECRWLRSIIDEMSTKIAKVKSES